MPEQVADLAVIGLGTFGSMAAWRATRRSGVRVVGLDTYVGAHSHGSYAGESRLYRSLYHEGSRYVPLLQESDRLWGELEALTGAGLLLRTGVLTVSPPDRPELAGVFASAAGFGLPHEVLDTAELARRFPQHRLSGGEIGVLDPRGGVLRSEAAVHAAQTAARAAGARLHGGNGVTAVDLTTDPVTVHTRSGTVRAGKVVVATGSTRQPLVPVPGLPPLVRRRLLLTWFLADRPADFAPSVFPAFLRDHGPVHLFGAPTLDGATVKVATTDVWGDVPVDQDLPGAPSRRQLSAFGATVAGLLPGLGPEPVRVSVHQDVYTPDRTPLVVSGPDPRAVVVTGFSGHGFKMAPAVGELAVALALGERTDSPFAVGGRPTGTRIEEGVA
ncbi:N-methyl-L-tryptophan oxidase [Nakamurella sp. YIM 132087]|uniref:N-methyl-L-tryptophan oxidase n=1 Tax=Nakamurella alba TaxID=2665158 RepID=A0A7K1FTX8_9ACTN|nr:N-methyl-L-tryptophan oxidase [Nakamurella alba]MTD16274.1 N-methyl-L-tryptophan oxidase [Nakamurella alba]